MDNGASPTDDVVARPEGVGSAQLTPPAPATNGTSNGASRGNSNGASNARRNGAKGSGTGTAQARNGQNRNGAAKKSTKKASPSKSRTTTTKGTRSHTVPVAAAAASTTVDDAVAALASVPTVDDEAMSPAVLPPIVPAETFAPPEVVPSDELVGDVSSDDSSDASDGGLVTVTALVATVDAPGLLAPPEFSDTDGTDGLPSLLKPKKAPRPLKPPVVRSRRRPRVRRVTRVVRHVDTWSVFKVAVIFNAFLYAVCLTAGVLLWRVAQSTGTVDNIERFFESFGWERFELKGGEIYHNAWIGGLFVVVGLTGLAVLMATMFNLITDLVGGVRVSVLEEEVVVREDRGLGWRRGRRRPPPQVTPPEPVE